MLEMLRRFQNLINLKNLKFKAPILIKVLSPKIAPLPLIAIQELNCLLGLLAETSV